MVGAYFDLEVFNNYVSFLFIDMLTKQEDIDAYIDADINDDDVRKREALSRINYKHFVLHEHCYQALAFYDFMKDIKLLIGYNNIKYDNLLVSYMYIYKAVIADRKNYQEAIQLFKTLSDNIIENNNLNYKYFDEELKQYREFWTSIDLLMSLFETISRKSLKQAAINIKWYRIEDLPLNPNTNVTKDQFSAIFDYNLNDVLITRALHIKKKAEFTLRINIGARYGTNVLSSNRSTIADRLMGKFYQEYTGLKYYQFKDKRTYRTGIDFADILNPRITFITPQLQKAFEEIRNTSFLIGGTYKKIVLFRNKGYKIATGGLHSMDRPADYKSDNKNRLMIDADVSSYYPSLIYNEGVCPSHLAFAAFNAIVLMIKTDKANYKQQAADLKKQGRFAESENAKTGEAAMKIVANSGLYGKLGYDGWLHDPKAMYQVTLNGQLYLMMLIEQLEEAGIEVISANTDGILAYFTKEKLDSYKNITTNWQTYTKLNLDFNNYIRYVRTSVNDYMAIKDTWLEDHDDNAIKRKGDFLTEVALDKGFNAPVVAIAIDNYIVNDVPIADTIHNHLDIYDYCISVKTGAVYEKQLHTVQNGKYKVNSLSKNLRYYVSNTGGTLLKHKINEDGSDHYAQMIKGSLITPFNDYFKVNDMSEYNINYQYYIKRCTDILLKIQGVYNRPGASRRLSSGSKKKGVSQIGTMFDNI